MPENMSDEQLKWGYWYVTHKLQLKKNFTIALIALNVVLWVYVLYGSLTLLLNFQSDRAAAAGLAYNQVSYGEYRDKNQFLPLDIIDQTVLSLGSQKYDLASQVENPNAWWAVPYLEYRFAWSGGQTEFKSGFILPGETKFFLALNIDSDTIPSDASLEFQNVKYLKMNSRINLPPGSEEGFANEDIQFVPLGAQPLQAGKTSASSSVSFATTNMMPYNFWDVAFKTILYQGQNIVGVQSVPVKQFKSREKRSVEMNWFQNLPQVTGIVIEPEVNLLDKSVFMPME